VLRWLLALGATSLVLLLPATALAGLSQREAALLREINRVRALHGLPRLRFDNRLEDAARSHSRHMLLTDALLHGPFGTRLARFGVRARVLGENLGWGSGHRATARSIVLTWLGSPMHRANLLRPSFTRVGVGCSTGDFLGTSTASVVTADFAG
jgi:uncharacterized protein YkwD